MIELKLFILLMIANGAPIVAGRLLGGLYSCPLDGGVHLADRQPLFGHSKTIRGLIAALVATIMAGVAMGFPVHTGILIGSLAMAGDLLSSFIKRRLHMPEGSRAIGLDHIPESLLPLIAIRSEAGLEWLTILILVATFVISVHILSFVLYKLKIRKRPY